MAYRVASLYLNVDTTHAPVYWALSIRVHISHPMVQYKLAFCRSRLFNSRASFKSCASSLRSFSSKKRSLTLHVGTAGFRVVKLCKNLSETRTSSMFHVLGF